MSIREKLLSLSNNALFAGVVGGLLVIAITAVITTYVVKRNTDIKEVRNIETVNAGDVEQALRNATEKVEASGYIISKLTPDDITDKMRDFPKFTASIVMVNPFSPIICQRQRDEDNQRAIISKFFQSFGSSGRRARA